jgi:hypothetical protein
MATVLLQHRYLKSQKTFQSIKQRRPKTLQDLKNYLSVFLNLNIGDTKICPSHDSPMDYLWHSFSEGRTQNSELKTQNCNNDCVVWAGRGGGKTYLAAAATLLDSIFKPGCKTRILAGSQTQAQRMYDYLMGFVHNGFEEFLADEKKNKCVFTNGSNVEVLTQSMASVRGSHIHKLRCDEVELFKKPIFEAAKFTTKTNNGIIASMEALSTMHQPFGIMHELVGKSQESKIRIFKWCIWEVIENCKDRLCSQCPLNSDCQGKAKQAGGYLKIDDVIAQMRRSSRAAFESEMLCLTPSLENVVFAEFKPSTHIAPVEYNPDLPLYRTLDFGFVNPFVCLWIQVDGSGTIRVIDEYIQSRKTIDAHADEIKNRKPYNESNVVMTFCDPAGVGVNDVTGTSPVSQLRKAGIKLRYRASAVLDGIELVRRALRTGDGKSNFVVSPRCGKLIEAMQSYHYPTSGSIEMPKKDGVYDHPIDALRYFFVNYNFVGTAKDRRY